MTHKTWKETSDSLKAAGFNWNRNGIGGNSFWSLKLKIQGRAVIATFLFKDEDKGNFTVDTENCRVVSVSNLNLKWRGDQIGNDDIQQNVNKTLGITAPNSDGEFIKR